MKETYGSDRAAAQYHTEPGKGNFLKSNYNENPLKIQDKLELLRKLHGKKYKNTINRNPFIVNVYQKGIITPYDALNYLISSSETKIGYNKL